jgi:hypothetical protein
MRKVTTIPAHRDNEGMKAGAFKTDMAGLSYKPPSRYTGTTRDESRCPQNGHGRAFIQTTIPAHRDNEGMKAGALDNRRDRAFI